jgi:hypothetical protein
MALVAFHLYIYYEPLMANTKLREKVLLEREKV